MGPGFESQRDHKPAYSRLFLYPFFSIHHLFPGIPDLTIEPVAGQAHILMEFTAGGAMSRQAADEVFGYALPHEASDAMRRDCIISA